MRQAGDDSNCGVDWIDNKRLTDLDFADDIALLDSTWKGMAELTKNIEKEAGMVGLRINADKTKLMEVGKLEASQNILVGGKQVEVHDFCYSY